MTAEQSEANLTTIAAAIVEQWIQRIDGRSGDERSRRYGESGDVSVRSLPGMDSDSVTSALGAGNLSEPAERRFRGSDRIGSMAKSLPGGYAWCSSFPNVPPELFAQWLGRRMILWPDSAVPTQRTSIVSSRIGKRPDTQPEWFDALRTVAARRRTKFERLCYAPGTAAADAVRRAGELFGFRSVRLEFTASESVNKEGLVEWLTAVLAGVSASAEEYDHTDEDIVWISPEVDCDGSWKPCRHANVPADAALLLVAHRILVLKQRVGGNIANLLGDYLDTPELTAPVLIRTTDHRSEERGIETLVARGGVPWILRSAKSTGKAATANEPSPVEADSEIGPQAYSADGEYEQHDTDGPLDHSDLWLCHWTRPRYGPWPDQTYTQFLDELILGHPTADRSACAALRRIIERKIIWATRTVAGAAATVSWTEVPLQEFRRRRIFRKHKQQFDFEPWGIAARRTFLANFEAQRVIYSDNEDSEDHEDNARVRAEFRQRRFNSKRTIDWSAEREWRTIGEVDLSQATASDIVVFVNTSEEAAQLRHQSPWRVISLPVTSS